MLRPGQRSGDVAGRGAVAELLLAGAPWRRAIGNQLLAGALWQSYCWPGEATEQDAAGRGAVAERLQRGGAVVEMLVGAPWHI